MSSFYKIISQGYPSEGHNKKEVIDRISSRFKIDTEKATRLVSGKVIVIKSGIDRPTMLKYCTTLDWIGLMYNVESSDVESKAPNSDKSVNGFACPKCGHKGSVNMSDPEASCVNCGVLFNKLAPKVPNPDTTNPARSARPEKENEVHSKPSQQVLDELKEFYNELPRSIQFFWRIMGIVYAVALLRAIYEGGVGFFIGVAIGAGIVWFYLPYYCMRLKGFWPWFFTIVWTFPFGLGLLSGSAKAYYMSDDS